MAMSLIGSSTSLSAMRRFLRSGLKRKWLECARNSAKTVNCAGAQSAEKRSCVGRDASKFSAQTWYGEVYECAHLRYRHAAGRRKQMDWERRMFGIGQDDF
jgi:hypothetical protein